MKVFISGVNGFVGEHLSSFFLSKGFQVYGNGRSDFKKNEIKYYKLDILDSKRLKSAISKIKPEIIVHLAAFSSVKGCNENPGICEEINVTGTKNILDSAAVLKEKPKILVVSSGEVYGNQKPPFRETLKLLPISPYGQIKKKQEEVCMDYFKKHSLRIIIARSFQHAGPGQQPIYAISDFAKQIAEIEKKIREPVIKVGNIDVKRDFTDIRDVVKAYLLAIEKCTDGETYNICSGKPHSIGEILQKMVSYTDAKIKIIQDPAKIRTNNIPILQGDCTKFMECTGWRPEIPIEDTLKDTLNFWRNKVK